MKIVSGQPIILTTGSQISWKTEMQKGPFEERQLSNSLNKITKAKSPHLSSPRLRRGDTSWDVTPLCICLEGSLAKECRKTEVMDALFLHI